MNEFEEDKGFDRKRTLRMTFRRQIRKYELEKAFENYEVLWDKMEIYHNPATLRMQYVYIVLSTNEEARRVMANKHVITHKFENPDIEIKALNGNITNTFTFFDEPENVVMIIKPESNLEVVHE